MKQKLIHFLSIFVAFLTAIPIANAAASDYKINAPTKNWTTTFTIPDDNSRQLAISKDGVPYTLSETDKFSGYVATYRITSSGNQLVNLGWTSTGAANAFDDAGNYVTHSAGTSGPTQTVTTNPASKYCVREAPNSTTATNGVFPNGSGVAMNGYTAGKVTLYLDATGDVRHGNGYIWFAQTGTSTNITCLVIKNVNGTPTVSGTKSFNTSIASGGGNDNYLNFYDTSNESAMKCLLQVRGVGIYDVTLNATAGTVTSVNAITCTSNAEYNSLGAHIFMMRGRKLLCRNTRRLGSDGAARNKYSEFEILDITDSYTNPTKIATIDHLPGKYSNGSSIGNGHQTGSFIQSYKHSEDKVEIFAYVQGSGCSSYFITASAITNPVTSLSAALVSGTTGDVKVSWANPSEGTPTKYAVSYSTDGGSSWSTEVETTNLNYTYANLADGTYTFKVRPYYGGSSTWGQATNSNSVSIVNYTDPVTNMQVQSGSGMPYSAIVNWAAPSGDGTPTKYAVSYSTNGGTSWSTAIETTGLTYTYSGLAQGEYIFKVTPYYGSTAGEATTKATTVYGVTTPVPVVNVAYYNNVGNSIAVSWTEPEGSVSPDKYQVCYTSNGGTSWSTVVESTDLTYTFSNLPVGTYTFKVTPIYNGFAGEAALSESINSLAPSGYTFTTSKRWDVRGTLGPEGAPDGKSIAVSNNMMYVAAPNLYNTMSYVSQSLGSNPASWPNFDTGFASYSWGYAMDNDDAGNIIAKTGSGPGSVATQFSVYPVGATANTNKKEITLTGDYLPEARFDFMAAQGNIYSGTGYIWFAPNGTKTVKRIKIENVSGTPTPTAVTTWTLPLTTSTQVAIRPLDDGRLYFHNRANSCAIITLPEGGGEVTSSMIENLSISATTQGNMNSDVFMLHGNTFHVKNDGAASSSIGIEIKNLTTAGNGDASYVPFDGLTPANGNSTVSGVANYGSLVRAVNVDENTADVYCYSPNHGVTVYRVTSSPIYTVTGAIKSLDYEYTTVETDEGTRQDVILTWTAPEEATPTSYMVYRDGTLIATVAAPALTYTDKNVNANHTYKVIPHFAGVAEDESLGLSVTTTEVETVIWAPIITEMRTYNGYSITQFFFKMPSLSTIKPVSFNIYRDAQLIESGITQYNYIDDDLPKISENKEYTYYVEAVYGATHGNEKRKSVGKSVTVTYRDWALAGYLIEEIYNVPINPTIGNLPNNFTNYDYYRQGQFYDGHWYIAQRADDLCQKDQDKANGITNSVRDDMKSDNENATGGVVVIKATEEHDVRMGFGNDNKIITNEAFENVGIAMDDKGTIFMRNNNVTKLAATTPSDGNATEVAKLHDGFGRRITEGHLYTRDANGSYSTTPITLDLTALWLDDRWIDDMVYTSGKSYGQVAGRSDYYYMWGDVMSAEGGYLILAPSWTRTAFKVKIANGAYVSHETIEFSDYTESNPTTGELETHVLATGSENYGFNIAGRDTWMAQIRSNGYFGVHDKETNADGSKHWHAIFDTDSRINNSGGTSIVAFGSADDDSDGETFLITPACMYSRNTGDFIVTRGIKAKIDDAASESKLSPPMPVAQFKQTNTSSNIATNANGNWFHAEPGTYESVTSANAECVYIYQYVPGMRFAKYRLFPDNQLPEVTPTLDIITKYNEAKTEITHFGGVSTWKRPKKFGLSDASNANVKVKSYSFELLNAKGEVVYEDEVLDEDYKNGTNPTLESEDFVYEFDYVLDKNIENVDNCDLDFQTYTARVAVNYEFLNGTIKQSRFNTAIDNNDYPAKPAEDLYIEAFVAKDITIGGWTEKEDGNWVVETQKADRYRIDLDFSKPTDAEPVSYYTIKAVVNKQGEYKGDTINIENFLLHNGSEIKDGKLWAKTTSTSQIPGTYDFENAKAPYYTTVDANGDGLYNVADGGSRRNVVLSYFYDVPVNNDGVATASNGDEVVINNTPDKWEFIIVAHYAARNTYIDKNEPVGITPTILTPTGVEVVGDDNASSLLIYPIPASTSITIKAGEAINTIVIYNEAGAEVMNLDGNGDTVTEVNIEDLANGMYFVKVNGRAPVKIIKK